MQRNTEIGLFTKSSDKTMPKEHILIVDDEKDILELIDFNLVREGYKVTGIR